MKLKSLKTFEDCLDALQRLEQHGGVTRTRGTLGKMVPLSENAKHIALRAMGFNRSRADQEIETAPLLSNTKREAEKQTNELCSNVDIRSHSHQAGGRRFISN